MKLALIYIATIIIVYVLVDFIIYLLSKEGPRRLLGIMRAALKAIEPEEALARSKTFQEEVVKWIETDHRMEYKSVWVGGQFANSFEDLAKRWKGDWPDEFVAEIEGAAAKLRAFYPKYLWTLFKAFAIAIILALVIRSFFVQAFKIPSGSMIPTLLVGDQLLVNKLKYGLENPLNDKKMIKFWKPKQGDIVVFRPPRSVESSWQTHELRVPFTEKVLFSWRSQVDFIKRIVGLPGDKIEVKDGLLYVNDRKCGLIQLKEFDYQKKYGAFARKVETQMYEESCPGQPAHVIIHDSPEQMRGDYFGPITVGPGEFFAMGDNRDDSADSRTWVGDPARIEDIRGQAFIIHFSWDPVENVPRLGRVFKLIH